jgi:hypothetical protein
VAISENAATSVENAIADWVTAPKAMCPLIKFGAMDAIQRLRARAAQSLWARSRSDALVLLYELPPTALP